MIKKIIHQLSNDIAIDLGTTNTLLYVKGRGIIAREPTVVALHKKSKQIIAVGSQAKHMIGKTPTTINTIRPIRNSVISDFDMAQVLIKHMLSKAQEHPGSRKFSWKVIRPRVLINIPSFITEVEKKAVKDVCLRAGAREVLLIENPMSAALGAGMLVEEPVGSGIICIGGGRTEMAIISLGGIVAGTSIKIAGEEFDSFIISYIRQIYNLLIGEKTAEEIKTSVGSAQIVRDDNHYIVRGRDLKTGLPKTIEVKAEDVAMALKSPLEEIARTLSDLIDTAPPEVVSDVLKHGITITGAGGQLKNLQHFFEENLRFPIRIADDPATCGVRGAAKALENPELLTKVKAIYL